MIKLYNVNPELMPNWSLTEIRDLEIYGKMFSYKRRNDFRKSSREPVLWFFLENQSELLGITAAEIVNYLML